VSKRALAWVRGYGFAALVFLAIAAGVFFAVQTDVPDPVPDFALQAPAIYRTEIGLGVFFALYLVSSLLVSALNGHGITQFGTGGIRVQRIVNEKQQSTILRQERAIDALRQAVKRSAFAIQGGLAGLARQNRELEGEVEALAERLRALEDPNAPADPE
jgi:hypothetical protein